MLMLAILRKAVLKETLILATLRKAILIAIAALAKVELFRMLVLT